MRDSGASELGAWVEELAWPQVQTRLESGAIAVLPVGASAKEHGLHLPMNTDAVQAKWLAQHLSERANILVWPLVGYGYYPAFLDFPGSCSIARGCFEHLVADILGGIFASGAESALILNTGISTIAPLENVIKSTHKPIKLANVYCGPRYLEAERRLREQPRGGHADELETSIMLAIAPDTVAMTSAKRWTPASMGPGKFVRGDPNHPNYCPDGAFGDPTLATREKGERLLEAMLEDLLAGLT
jgi:creatinine amidohydrolase